MVKYDGTTTHSIVIREAAQKTCFFIEPAHNNCPPIMLQSVTSKGEPAWEHDSVDFEEIRRIASVNAADHDSPSFGKFFSSIRSTSKAKSIGISPNYIKILAKTDCSEVQICHGFCGEVFCLQAGEIPFLVRPGSFLMCEMGVILDIQMVSSNLKGINDAFLIRQLGYSGFIKIFGDGLCFLQGGSFFEIIELKPGESCKCHPKYIMGFSESVSIRKIDYVSSDLAIRHALGADYEFVLKADERGGIICLSNKPVFYDELMDEHMHI